MDRNVRKVGLINLIVYLVIGGAVALLTGYGNIRAGGVGALFFLAGFLVMVMSFFQMGLEERERVEKLEFDELRKGRGAGASLFTGNEDEVLPARRAREQFERFLVPAFTVLLFALEVAAVIWLWAGWLERAAAASNQPVIVMAWFAAFFLVLFLLGRYSASLSRLQKDRLLRPGASYLILGAYICALVTLSTALVWGGFAWVDLWVARALCVILGLLAVETLVTLILEIYRPRVRGKVGRLLYDSRLVGILAQPEGIFTTAAQALDYQFGFKVSETWFYRFLEKALGWLILLQGAVLVLSSCFVFVEPGEEALVERFGRPRQTGETLKPGLHVKLPWPIDRVYRSHTQKIQSFYIGFTPESDAEHEEHQVVVWTSRHVKDEVQMLVASRTTPLTPSTNRAAAELGVPADLLTVEMPVQFRIEDLRAWVYTHRDPAKLLENIGTREVVRYFASVDLFSLMSAQRAEAADELQRRIQKEADRWKLGVRIVFVGLQDIHPPVKVASSFENVISAQQENQAKLRQAEGYFARVTELAKAEAQSRTNQAQSYYHRTVEAAKAQAAQFTHQAAAFRAAPDVYVIRSYLESLERGGANSRKYILATTNTQDVLLFNLEDKIREDFLDIQVPGPRN